MIRALKKTKGFFTKKARFVAYFLLGVFYTVALLGSFEIAYDAWEHGAIESPIWSSVFGFPFLHHYLFGFLLMGVVIVLLILIKRKH